MSGPTRGTAAFEVVTLGETMVQVTAEAGGGFDSVDCARLGIGGAESNVASYLAQLGHRVAWLSRVGADPFGRRILAELGRLGVDTTGVVVDDHAPTGVYFKSPRSEGGTDVHYYRRHSAASRMSRQLLSSPQLAGASVLHVSGITGTLSATCDELVTAVVQHRSAGEAMISFDVNYRPALWTKEEASTRLLELARASDLVFVGLDEAHTLWATQTPGQVRELIGQNGTLVVKDSERGATAFGDDGDVTECPTTPVDVVESVGAGDAFAAGYLHGMLAGLGERDRLQSGHRLARTALGTYGDVATLSGIET